MPLFYPPLPAPFTLEDPDITVLSTTTTTTAGRAFFMPVVLLAPITVAQMRCYVASAAPTGNIDMGIYDATGTNAAPNNLQGHTGAIAATTGVFTKSLTSNLVLLPGQYWLAFLDTAADLIGLRGTAATNIGVLMQTNSTSLTVLPATAGTVANSGFRIGVEALLLGGWS